MAETWSTSRPALVVSEFANVFSTDRESGTVGAKRTYIQRECILDSYLFIAHAIWAICTPHNPETSDITVNLSSIIHADTTKKCLLISDMGVVNCITIAADTNGPVVLEYPKYFNDATIPPNFDVVFRIYSSAAIDWSSFVLTISTTSGENKSYSQSDITVIDITNEIKEVRLQPEDMITMIGDTVNVQVYLKDSFGRVLDKNW